MTRDYTQFIHRVRADREDEGFFVTGDMWGDANPDWRVLNWTLDQLDEEFPDLRMPVSRTTSVIDVELLYGVALVEKWGGIWVASLMEPEGPLVPYKPGLWVDKSHTYFGAEEPGEDFWHQQVHEIIHRPSYQPSDLAKAAVENSAKNAVHES